MADQGARLTGVVGELRWGYYPAARVEKYQVVRDKKTRMWSLRARVVPGSVNVFNLKQKPLRFIAPFVVPAKDGKPPEKRQWEWRVDDGDLAANGMFSARLEPLGRF